MNHILPLTVEAAVVKRGGKHLIGPLDMRVDGGGISAIMGPNGSGKTTLLRLCHGLLTPTAGRCVWTGPGAHMARRHQALVFQHPALLRRSVRGNVEYPLKLRGTDRADRRTRTDDIMARARLTAFADRPADVLSGGEQQRLAIARAWVTRPEVLFLDEPTASLDPGATRDIEALIQSIAEAGTTIVMTSHDLGQIKRLADTVLFLYRGQIVEKGSVAAIFDTPKSETLAAFLAGEIVE